MDSLLSSSSSTPYLDLEEGADFLKTAISWEDDPEYTFIGPEEFGLSYTDGIVNVQSEPHTIDKLEEYRLGKRTASGSSIYSTNETTVAKKEVGSSLQGKQKEPNTHSGKITTVPTAGNVTVLEYEAGSFKEDFEDGTNPDLHEKASSKQEQAKAEVDENQILKKCENKETNIDEARHVEGKGCLKMPYVSVYSQKFPPNTRFTSDTSKPHYHNSHWRQESSFSFRYPPETGKIVVTDATDKNIDNEIEKIRQKFNTRKFFRSWVWEPETKAINNYLKKEIISGSSDSSERNKKKQQNSGIKYCKLGPQNSTIKGQSKKNNGKSQKRRAKCALSLSSSLPAISSSSTGAETTGTKKRSLQFPNITVDDLVMKYRRQHTELIEVRKRRQESVRLAYDNSLKITKQQLQRRYFK